MPLGTLQSFIQNFEAGQANARAQAEWKQKQDALAALGKMLGQDPTAPQPAAPGPQGAPAAPLPASPGAVAPQGLAALPGATPAQPAAPSAGPVAKPVDPNLSATAQPEAMSAQGGDGSMDAIRDAQQNIAAMARSIKAANPGIDPRTLAIAVEQQIDNVKGLAPLTKATMTAQVQTIRLTQDFQYKQMRLQQYQQDLQIKLMRAKTEEEKAQALAEYHQQMIDLGYERIDASKEIAAGHDATRVSTNAATNASREGIAAAHEAGATDRAVLAEQGREYGADQGVRGRQAASGGKTDPAPAKPSAARAARPPVPGARKAPDGHWYVQKGSQFFRVE